MTNRLRTLLTSFALSVFVSAGGSYAIADETSEAILNLYFDAIGGREVWAEGHGEYVLAKVKDPRFPLPATFEFCWSWDGPQTADRSRFQGFTQVRGFTGKEGWTFRRPSRSPAGELADWDEARRIRGLAEWNGNIEVLTHRMAKRDVRISTRMGKGPWKTWVEISADDEVVAYLLNDENGAPVKFYRVFDDAAVTFGPLAERGEIRFPAWGAFEGGDPFDIIAFEILDAAPIQAFSAPDPHDPGYLQCR